MINQIKIPIFIPTERITGVILVTKIRIMRVVNLSGLPQETKNEVVKKHVLDMFRTKEGFSIGKDLNEPKSGYMVGGFGFHEVVNSEVNRDTLKVYISEVMEFLSKQKNDLFFGGWYNENNNTFELELSINFKYMDSAILTGQNFNEISIWDVSKGKEIKL